MPAQMGNSTIAGVGRKKNRVMQPAADTGTKNQIAGVRKGRLRSGAV